jgi:hypothetical protein
MIELCRGEAQLTCAVGNVIISTSGKTPDPGYLQLAVRTIDDYSRTYPWGLGWIVLIAEDEPPPDENGRRGIINMRNALKGCMRASVMVVEGQGFAASAKRSIIAMFSLASTQPYPTRVAGDVHEGAQKLAQMLGRQLDPGLDPQVIAEAVESVRNAAPKT